MIELEKLLAAGGTPDDIRSRIEKPSESLAAVIDAANDVTVEKEKEKEKEKEGSGVKEEQAEGVDSAETPVSVPTPVPDIIQDLTPEVAAG